MLRAMSHGGDIIADVLARHGVTHLFTLCGGHISPILTGAQARGLRVVDVRDEANAVFAADAVARMTGTVGVAAVTAGPGVTNTVTAVKNAQMAQSPVVILGGATATLLKGRGSLQDIDQMAVMKSLTKWATAVKTVPRPVFVIGSQALVGVKDPGRLARALGMLGVPVFLGGMARGLLGRSHELQLRHNRGDALKRADVIVVCGFPFDFRLGYGRGIPKRATLVAANLSAHELRKNRRPDIPIQMHAGEFLVSLADR